MADSIDQWEYDAAVLLADADSDKQRLKERWPNQARWSKYAVPALVPQLNDPGKQGWELVSFEPVWTGKNEDVLIPTAFEHRADLYIIDVPFA